MNSPIIVTGVPRSGTSLTCGVLNTLGAFGGDMRGPTDWNQKGMFENRRIVGLVKDYLRSIDCDPLAQHPLPALSDLRPWPTLQNDIEQAMRADGYEGGVWFFKTVKGCHLWPLFMQAFPLAHWIIVERPKEQVIDSLLRTPFMRAYNTREGWDQYIEVHKKRFAEIERNGLDVVRINSNRIINGDYTYIRRFAKRVGLEWDEDVVREFVEPSLWSVA